MSPVLILSRLCLNRRFQFFGISGVSSCRTGGAFLSVSSSVTRRRPAVPVLGHLGDVVLQDGEDLLDGLLVDDAAEAGDPRVLAGDHHRHVVVQDLDGEVLALLTEHLLQFLLEDLPRPVMGIDDVVADLELDVDDLDLDLEVLQGLLFGATGNDGPPSLGVPPGRWDATFPAEPRPGRDQVCRYRSTRLISCNRRRPSRMSFARISPTPSTVSSSASVAASSSSRPPNSLTICATTSFGSRGTRPRIRKPRGETG